MTRHPILARLTPPDAAGHRYWIAYGRGRPPNGEARPFAGIDARDAARAVWVALHGEPDSSAPVIGPKCGDPNCIAPRHLTARPRGRSPRPRPRAARAGSRRRGA